LAVNAAGLDDTVFADTLFGHVRGTYTGATEARRGAEALQRSRGNQTIASRLLGISQPALSKRLKHTRP
jgi:transcriptional regulator with PAS, ATPase and Fis domain